MPGSLSHLLRALLKDLFSTRPIVTIPLNIAIESFSPFPALFFCITLLRTDTLCILLISVVYCLYPTPNSKHHESGVPLNIAIESFSSFPALFFCITLLRPDMLCILLISVVYCLYPTPNSKHHESGVLPHPYIPSPVTGRCLIDICGISEHLFTLHPL